MRLLEEGIADEEDVQINSRVDAGAEGVRDVLKLVAGNPGPAARSVETLETELPFGREIEKRAAWDVGGKASNGGNESAAECGK